MESIPSHFCWITLYKELDGTNDTLSGKDDDTLELATLDIKYANYFEAEGCCWKFYRMGNFAGIYQKSNDDDYQKQMGATTTGPIRVTGVNFSIKSVRRVDC